MLLFTNYYTITYDDEEEDWNLKESKTEKINIKEHLYLMSARYKEHNRYDLLNNEFLLEAIENEKQDLNIKENKVNNRVNVLSQNIDLDIYDFSKIQNSTQLDNLIELFIESLNQNEYELKKL